VLFVNSAPPSAHSLVSKTQEGAMAGTSKDATTRSYKLGEFQLPFATSFTSVFHGIGNLAVGASKSKVMASLGCVIVCVFGDDSYRQ
jgi:hypothetical protein